jgi:hypothetical protein
MGKQCIKKRSAHIYLSSFFSDTLFYCVKMHSTYIALSTPPLPFLCPHISCRRSYLTHTWACSGARWGRSGVGVGRKTAEHRNSTHSQKVPSIVAA